MSDTLPASFPSFRHDVTVNLAHISDPHLPVPALRARDFFNKRAFSLALWKASRKHHHLFAITEKILTSIETHKEINAILITGDLTNFGTREEFEFACQWLKKFFISPIIIPGNHDMMMPEPFEKSLALWKPWTGPYFPFIRLIEGVAIIGLNSAVPTPLFKAYGRLDPNQLKKLSFLLEHLGQAGYCRIVMLHHPPKIGLMDNVKALKDMNEFSAVLREKGAELVLHGHSHKMTFTHVEGCSVPLLGTSSVSMKNKNPLRQAGWTRISCKPSSQGWLMKLCRFDEDGINLWTKEWESTQSDALFQTEWVH
ncbi:metallophosphoesterase [Acetobacteraceae bacterium ESL0709]|nr:metallophosphoesterase [Acetobacteraceae bacterium ESL0697]MDF7678187.1 metallophosphoesterase [Acetobacteraceae bacterium ESL0709]